MYLYLYIYLLFYLKVKKINQLNIYMGNNKIYK